METEQKLVVENYIGGQFQKGKNVLSSVEPATGKVWALIPDSSEEDMDCAVKAALQAFPSWSSKSVQDRCAWAIKIAEAIEANAERLAALESRDQGKPLWLARTVEIPRASHNFRAFAEYYQHHLEDSNCMTDAGLVNYTRREPIGVAALISPWNLPLYLLTFKLAPAIVTGNTVVCKPSELTSVTSWELCKLLDSIGLPAGVINMVCGTGKGAGEPLVSHPDVHIISFTGSTVVGKRINSIVAPMLKKVSLELGGKNPGIIFDDVDLGKCMPTLMRSCFLNQGEVCLSTSRLFIQKNIWDKFVPTFVDSVRKLKVGAPEDNENFLGALISSDHRDKVLKYIHLAKEDGATIHCGETVDQVSFPSGNENGYFLQPTVMSGVKDSSQCMQEEIFGPVVCLVPFESEEEVIYRANDVPYGLCASVFGSDVGRVHRVAHKIKAGTVWINTWLSRSLDMPFGGMKQSGIGREGTRHSLELYTELKTIGLKIQ